MYQQTQYANSTICTVSIRIKDINIKYINTKCESIYHVHLMHIDSNKYNNNTLIQRGLTIQIYSQYTFKKYTLHKLSMNTLRNQHEIGLYSRQEIGNHIL